MSDFKKDYYKSLGVAESASTEEIKQAFHNLAFKYHPDRPGGDEKRFKEINEAYQTLSNSDLRSQYDNMRKFGGSSGGFNGASNFNWNNANFSGGDFGGFSGFNDIFESFFGQGFNSRNQEQPQNEDIEIKINISLKESFSGITKEIKYNRFNTCSSCDGKGYPANANVKTCKNCNGKGYVERKRNVPLFGTISEKVVCSDCKGEGTIPDKKCSSCSGSKYINETVSKSIEIPAGIRNGDVLELKNFGHNQNKKYRSGNLYIKVLVQESKDFWREGDNLRKVIQINFAEAALGIKKEVESLDGKILIVDIPNGIESDSVLKIRHKGFKSLHSNTFGDLLLSVKIITPKKLSKVAQDLFKKLENEL
jgi:molecular chaperone DnaJ